MTQKIAGPVDTKGLISRLRGALFRPRLLMGIMALGLCAPALGENHEALESENESTDLITESAPDEDTPPTATDEPVEQMKVTGSRIRRIDLQSPNPTTIWTKEDLENKGYFNVSDFFINSPLSHFGDVNVHNRSTLQLVNGSRLNFSNAGEWGNGIKTVIDFLPVAAIERVEILKGASSALYGSDVTGGVVNIITKKFVDRPELSIKISPALYPFYKGGDQAEASLTFGKKFHKGNFISAWQFQYGRRLKVSERSKKWHDGSLIDYSPHPVFITGKGDSTAFTVDPACPLSSNTFVKTDQACRYNQRAFDLFYTSPMPSFYDISSYNYGEYRLNSRMKFYSQLFGFFKRSHYPGRPPLSNLYLPAGHKMSQGGGAEGTLKHLFEGVLEKETNTGLFVDGTIGIQAWLSKTWDLDFLLKWSSMWDKTAHKNALLKQDLIQAVATGAYDPFNPNRRDLSRVGRHTAYTKNNDSKIYSSLDFSGELGLWDIDMAVGLQAWHDIYTHIIDDKIEEGQVFAHYSSSASSGPVSERSILAAYLEGIKNFSDTWELQTAGRLDYYFDFGMTANPSVALLYKPNDNFLIRWSGGRSFEAPGLIELYAPLKENANVWISHPRQSFSFDTVACYNELKAGGHFQPIHASLGTDFDSEGERDRLIREFLIEQSSVTENKKLSSPAKQAFKGLTGQIKTAQHCKSYNVTGQSEGNKDIDPAVAYRSSLGFHWEPVEDHNLTVDAWWNHISGDSSPFPFANKKVFDAELRHDKKYVEEHSAIRYERESPAHHKVKNPIAKTVSLSQRQLYGIDAKWRSDFKNRPVGGGWFYFEDEFAWVISAGVENFPGMGFVNNLGKYGIPKWRNFANLGWRNNSHDISLLLKSTAGVKKANNEFESLPMENIVDLFYQYRMDEKTAFKLGFYNLLFLDPVTDDSVKNNLKINTSFYDVRGPRFFVELRRTL